MSNNVAITFTGREAHLHASVHRIIQQFATTEGQVKRVERAGQSMGDTITASLTRMGAGFLSATAALGTLTQAFEHNAQIRIQAAERIRAAEMATRELSQINASAGAMAGAQADIRRLRVTEGMTKEEAARFQFAAQSAGMQQHSAFFASLGRIGLSPETGVMAQQVMEANFGAGVGSPRQTINRMLAGAGPARMSASEMARESAGSAINWKQIGGTPDELYAVLGIMANALKSPEIGADRMRAIATQLGNRMSKGQIDMTGREGLGGLELILSLPQMFKEGRIRDESGKGTISDPNLFFTDEQPRTAYNIILANAERMRQQTAAVRAAGMAGEGGDMLSASMAAAASDPELASSRARRIAEQQAQVAGENRFGNARNVFEAMQQRQRAIRTERGDSQLATWLIEKTQGMDAWLFGENFAIDRMNAASPDLLRDVAPQLSETIASRKARMSALYQERKNSIFEQVRRGTSVGDPGPMRTRNRDVVESEISTLYWQQQRDPLGIEGMRSVGPDPQMTEQTEVLREMLRMLGGQTWGRLPVMQGVQPLREPGAERREGRPPPLVGRN